MKSRFTLIVGIFAAALLLFSSTAVAQSAVTPSTNDINQSNGWAHFIVDATSVPGQATLTFISTRNFASCFEYRTDGDTSQSTGVNPNADITDGLYPYTCVNNSSTTVTVTANEYIEVRMVFGAERDERFTWTRVDVVTVESCKNGGWDSLGFKNQGQCIKWVNTGKDSRP